MKLSKTKVLDPLDLKESDLLLIDMNNIHFNGEDYFCIEDNGDVDCYLYLTKEEKKDLENADIFKKINISKESALYLNKGE